MRTSQAMIVLRPTFSADKIGRCEGRHLCLLYMGTVVTLLKIACDTRYHVNWKWTSNLKSRYLGAFVSNLSIAQWTHHVDSTRPSFLECCRDSKKEYVFVEYL
ncbi:hypothetical protein BDV26DRAFT_251675 [Aspergillus bertholletiae]|uniref:Uncharacterized protein n=1 Tax=Aspergillus bertholletiae TaxID=1226010 RepID=A0A5N7BNJ4_9EURO|nr:hypothetical protein BDV26DRAFT_251675 [Aspergillus bertholletiae]